MTHPALNRPAAMDTEIDENVDVFAPYRCIYITGSPGCQTDPEPVEAVTQTTMDRACQTEVMPEGNTIRTLIDVEIQTVKVVENFNEADKFVVGAMHEMVALPVKHTID